MSTFSYKSNFPVLQILNNDCGISKLRNCFQCWKSNLEKFHLIISTHLLSFLKMVSSKFSAWKNTSSHFMMKIHFMIDVILHRLRTGSRQKWLTVQNVISMLRKKFFCKIWMRKHFVKSIIREELKQNININIIAFFAEC